MLMFVGGFSFRLSGIPRKILNLFKWPLLFWGQRVDSSLAVNLRSSWQTL
ncbi:unnamed protein product, partial [Amoebophrya sp. A120]|eukprot:GSA120T00020138001.1